MYDTVLLWLDARDIEEIDILAEIPSLLCNIREQYSFKHQCSTVSGSLDSFFITVSENGVLLNGSLCKFYFGENQRTLAFSEVKLAIEKLSALIRLPVDKALVYRLDMAENFVVSHPEEIYYDFLGPSRYYKRVELENGVYFTNNRRQLVFYGKLNEQSAKRISIREEFLGKNIIRYECRFKRKLPVQLNKDTIRAADLYDSKFYLQLLERYRKEYFSLYRYNRISFEKNTIKDVKSFQKQILLLGIQSLGGEAAAIEVLEQGRLRGAFSNRMQKRRLKDSIRKLCKTPLLTYAPDEIKELDTLVMERIKNEISAVSM